KDNAPAFEMTPAPPKASKAKSNGKPKADKPAAKRKAGASETE
ncbi:MAG: hypothetical protein QOK41_1486, partial [Sphingomonadales bacterium]|nr:hypothetical protein [Sphingomonadales bacterium]